MTINQEHIRALAQIFEDNKVCSSHGIDHALNVLKHAENALVEYKDLNATVEKEILYAALLHDADDQKLFKKDVSRYPNARRIIKLADFNTDSVKRILRMIEIVSASKYGDTIPDDVEEYMLIPRYSDRVEALGQVGIQRCYTYTLTIKNPLFTKDTPRVTSEQELWQVASQDRYEKYCKGIKSVSMIDHFYDKLLRLGKFPINNKYLFNEAAKRQQPLVDFVLAFGKTGKVDVESIKS